MLKKPITYTNFNNETVTRDFYFNLTKAEIALRELSSDGTFSAQIEQIKASDKGSEVMPAFVNILKWAYGVKSDDGERFIKNDEVWTAFQESPAYSVLIMELLSDGAYGAQFITAVLPPELAPQIQAQDGFRPGAQTLPQSRVDQLNAAQQQTQADQYNLNQIQAQQQADAAQAEAARRAQQAQEQQNEWVRQQQAQQAQAQQTSTPRTDLLP